jgi:hypothetical protein
MIKKIWDLLTVFFIITGMTLILWQVGMSRSECNELHIKGYTVKKTLWECEVLIQDHWIDSRTFFEERFNKKSTFDKKVTHFQI